MLQGDSTVYAITKAMAMSRFTDVARPGTCMRYKTTDDTLQFDLVQLQLGRTRCFDILVIS